MPSGGREFVRDGAIWYSLEQEIRGSQKSGEDCATVYKLPQPGHGCHVHRLPAENRLAAGQSPALVAYVCRVCRHVDVWLDETAALPGSARGDTRGYGFVSSIGKSHPRYGRVHGLGAGKDRDAERRQRDGDCLVALVHAHRRGAENALVDHAAAAKARGVAVQTRDSGPPGACQSHSHAAPPA